MHIKQYIAARLDDIERSARRAGYVERKLDMAWKEEPLDEKEIDVLTKEHEELRIKTLNLIAQTIKEVSEEEIKTGTLDIK